jgi:[ribosomal protein S18]-alanine N-acetyltransferase
MLPSLSPFTFRAVGPEAAGSMTVLHEECFPRYWDRDSFTDFFSVSGTYAVLADHPDSPEHPAGMFVYRVTHEQADIITLAVRPAFRRTGLARAMLRSGLEHCGALGAEAMLLEVEVGNTAAIGLYEQFGFVQIHRRRLYYQQRDGTYNDAFVMRRKLSVS